jgi:phenylpropionate dioxygenase-like ring-hydroxylating dioxygenase large terminal subunit
MSEASGAGSGADDLARLIAERRPGFSLQQEFYTSARIYRLELEKFLLQRWLCVGHGSRIPKTGDYFLFEIDRESLILVRGRDGDIRALANVCRHRGSRVCYDSEGSAKLFLCPYHGWGYELDGRLRAARHPPDGFDPSAYGLESVQCRVVQGLIFVNFAEQPIDLAGVEALADRVAGPYGWADAEVAHREVYAIHANWKLAVENYLECYHCAPAHPEYAKLHSNDRPRQHTVESTANAAARARAMGIEIPTEDQWALNAPDGQEAMLSVRYAMKDETVSGSRNGASVAPLMGRFSDYDGAATFFHIGPTSFYLAYCDYGVIYRFTPRAPQETEMEVTWLVRAGSKPDVDYDLDRLTWLWKVTSEEDKLIIEKNQAGVSSRFYQPGPYAAMESNTRRFTEWVLSELTPGGTG